jgi:hypothetical protein
MLLGEFYEGHFIWRRPLIEDFCACWSLFGLRHALVSGTKEFQKLNNESLLMLNSKSYLLVL